MTPPRWRERTASLLEWLALTVACLTVAWGPLAQGSTFGWGLSGLTLMGCLTITLTLISLGVRGRVNITNPWWLGSALLFLGWIWLSTTWAPYQWEAHRWAGVWTAVIGTAVSLHLLTSTRARQWVVLGSMVLTGSAALALAYLQTQGTAVPGFEYYPGTGPELVTGPYFNPSHFSGYLIILASLSTGLLLFTRLHLHSLALIALLVALHWLNLKTDSSSIPAVLLATVTPLLVWVWTKHRVTGATLTALALTAGIGGAAYFTTPDGQATFKANQEKLGISRDWQSFIQQRQAVWRYGEDMWKQHPIQGVGIGQFQERAVYYRKAEREVQTGMDSKKINYAHNDLLQIASELGAIGVFLALVTLILTVIGRDLPVIALVAIALMPALLLAGVYDAHLSAIPGTAIAFTSLIALAALRNSRKEVHRVPFEFHFNTKEISGQ